MARPPDTAEYTKARTSVKTDKTKKKTGKNDK